MYNFFDNYCTICSHRGKKPYQLANGLGIKSARVEVWKHGVAFPKKAELDAIADALEVPPYVFFISFDGDNYVNQITEIENLLHGASIDSSEQSDFSVLRNVFTKCTQSQKYELLAAVTKLDEKFEEERKKKSNA